MHSTASAHTSPVKDGRRILGEKTANACLSPARPRHAASLSPAKRPFLEAPSFTSPSKKLLPSPRFAGQKRTIDQVEGPREHESSTRERAPATAAAAAAPIHAQEELPPKSAAIAADEQIPSDATQQPSIPDRETQQQQQQQQPQQQQNEVAPHQQQEQQQQPSKPTHPSTQHPTPPSTRAVLTDPATRKRFIQEKATLLRTRLQTAMRHVRDPQLDRRLSALEAHRRKCPRLAVAETSGSHTPAPGRAGAGAGAGGGADPKTPVPFATTSTFPQQPERHASPEKHASGLSSPPLSTGHEAASARREAEEEDGEEAMKTPTQKMYRRTTGTASPMQLSSPPATVSRRRMGAGTGTGTGTGREESDGEEDGMAMGFPETQRRFSQKGDAVDGLLKLMGTAEHAGKAEARTG